MTGVKGVQAIMGGLFTAFPDIKFAPGLVLANGKNLVTVMSVTGTNNGPFMGQPATKQKLGIVGLREQTFTDDGKKIAWERHVVDGVTMGLELATGGKAPPHRGLDTVTMPAAPTIVNATDSQTEKDNLALVMKGCDAFNTRDPKAVTALYTDDAVISDYTAPADLKGSKDFSALLGALFKAFPDVKGTCKGWSAGDYVVNSVEWTATNTGAAPEIGLMKATGKPLSIHDSEIYEIHGGKITHYWRFSNGAAMAMQLGLMAPPPPAPATPPAAPAPAK
jgi:steroid delta-isomerase-like uncharacterized protein